MNESSEEAPSRDLADTSNDEKKNAALTALSSNFTKHLRDIMTKSDFDVDEKELYHPTFKRFMLLTLSKSAENLCNLLHRVSKTISEQEEITMQSLISKSKKIQLEPRLDHAMRLFSSHLPQYLKNLMRNAGYLASDTEENQDCYVSFFSSVIAELTNLFIHISTLEPDFHASAQIKKRKFNEPEESNNGKETDPFACKMPKLTLPPSETSTFRLITSTKRHLIYCVASDSSKDILVKVIKSQPPAAKDVKNLDNELKVGRMIMHPSIRFFWRKNRTPGKASSNFGMGERVLYK